ncbi:Gfo/Idh/MocA family oxidoreductase [Arthrobacter sp. CC3]|uniref:Gfo/Idh/MocA family protein n=1 Tax=Arthrobacter sp. CC3 TaxID=3029185 RepID=UPI003263B33F
MDPEEAPLRIGILGASRVSPTSIIESARLTGARLVAVAARDRDRAQDFADRYGVERALGSYEDLVNDPEIEAVYNPLANSLHARWNLAAIAAGKHVLSEKPFAANAAEARDVRDAGKRTGVKVVDGFHYLYHPVTKRLHELVASGELGELQRVETMVMIPPPPPEDPRWSLPLAGGALMDLGCYSLHAIRAMAPLAGGSPTLINARGAERTGLPGVDEWVDADLVYPSGITATARCNMNGTRAEMTYRAIGSKGQATVANFILPHTDDSLEVKTTDGQRIEHPGTRSSYTYQLDAFTALIRHGTPMPTDSDDAVQTMELIDQCYKAIGMEPRASTRNEANTHER